MNKRIVLSALLVAAILLVPQISQARYLNTGTGRFQTMDTYKGNKEDPLSLHKYLYVQDNPVNKVDPSGQSGESSAVATSGITDFGLTLFATVSPVIAQAAHRTGADLQFSAEDTTLGKVERLLVAEVREPGQPGFNLNDSEYGLYGVGAVIVNRVLSPKFPKSIDTVVAEPGQFAGFEKYPDLSPQIKSRISDLQAFANLKGPKVLNYRLQLQNVLRVARRVVAKDESLDAFVPAGGPYIPTLYFCTAGSANPWGGPARQSPWYRDTAGGNDFYTDRQ